VAQVLRFAAGIRVGECVPAAMYQAPVVAIAIGLTQLLRSQLKDRELPSLYLHYFTWLYVILFVLLCMAIHALVVDIWQPTDFMDPVKVEDYVKHVMSGQNDTSSLSKWKNEADLTGTQWLKWLSFSAPLWCLGTFVVCVKHTMDHVKQIQANSQSKKLCDNLYHDQTITILALPMVYGLMSFKSVIRALMICMNHVPTHGSTNASDVRFSGYEERKAFLLEMYGANFEVGDIYETTALVTFGHLVTTYLGKQLKKKLDAKGDAVVDALSSVTVSGVKLFAYSCLMSGTYSLIITGMYFYFPSVLPSLFNMNPNKTLGTLQQEGTKSGVETFFYGFGFAASFAAINNIMALEHSFDHYLENFHPSVKFWGTKILVSLACIQSSLLALCPLEEIQKKLFYATILCIECFFIALFHMKGWRAEETWYKEGDTMTEPLLSS